MNPPRSLPLFAQTAGDALLGRATRVGGRGSDSFLAGMAAGRGSRGTPWRGALSVLALVLTVVSMGCRAVPVHQQRFVARPSMQFSDSPVYTYHPGLLSQIESGAAASGGAQAAGCTSCR